MLLQDIWFFLWGLLWALYFATDGFDLGVGVLLPILGKTDEQRRLMYNAIGPLWNGNEVWLISAGGVTFAAFPLLYSIMFSSLYSALMLILFGLILRGVAVELRGKASSLSAKERWDWVFFFGSLLPAILFGAAFGNIFKGLPIDEKGLYQGSIFTLLNPYGLITGVLFLLMFMLHGSLWLGMRIKGNVQIFFGIAKKLWNIFLVVLIIFLILTPFFTNLLKNYLNSFVLSLEPILAIVFLLLIRFYIQKKDAFKAWVCSFLTIVLLTFFGIIGLYPNMFISSIDSKYSLTAYNASSSPLTLKIMLIVVILFVPIVLLYQGWAYKLFKAPITDNDFEY
jgi:cytochrome d ubiquinol oxidase subunit II